MKILFKLVRLIHKYPNDMELGEAIRKWYFNRFK